MELCVLALQGGSPCLQGEKQQGCGWRYEYAGGRGAGASIEKLSRNEEVPRLFEYEHRERFCLTPHEQTQEQLPECLTETRVHYRA